MVGSSLLSLVILSSVFDDGAVSQPTAAPTTVVWPASTSEHEAHRFLASTAATTISTSTTEYKSHTYLTTTATIMTTSTSEWFLSTTQTTATSITSTLTTKPEPTIILPNTTTMSTTPILPTTAITSKLTSPTTIPISMTIPSTGITNFSTTPPTTTMSTAKLPPTITKMSTALIRPTSTIISTLPLATTMSTTTKPTTASTATTMFTPTKSLTICTTTLFTSVSTTQIAPTTRIPTTTTRTTESPTSTVQNPRPLPCKNGATFDGIRCVCPAYFFGLLCEFIADGITLGKTLEVYVKVELKFTNVEMTLNLLDHMTEDFKQFNAKFKSEMKTVYSGLSAVPGYKDVIIRSIRQGSVIVEHDVVAEIEFKSDENITGQYDRTLQAVKRHLEELTSSNCTYGTTPMCLDGNIPHVLAIPPRSEEELCRELVPDGYTEFYSPVLSSDGLSCVSRCDLRSPNYLHCNDGVCQVERATGPQCFCSRTDLYIYSTSQCSGRIAKLDLYVGGGVTIGVLVIVIVTLIGFYLYRVKLARPKPFLTEDLYFTTGNIDQ